MNAGLYNKNSIPNAVIGKLHQNNNYDKMIYIEKYNFYSKQEQTKTHVHTILNTLTLILFLFA